MAKRSYIILSFFVFVVTGSLSAQSLLHPLSITKGTVIDDSTGAGIAFVHIYNETTRKGYIANEEGKFVIPASTGDTLVMSAIGFLSKVVFINDENIESAYTVRLSPRTYEIGEVKVFPFKNYEDFKKEFLALKLPETKTDELRKYLADISSVQGKQAAEEAKARELMTTPGVRLATVGIPIPSKDDIQRAKYAEVLKKEARQRVINEKYNRDVIRSITQLPDDEIIDFMGFCNFSEDFLYASTEYQIYLKIVEKFKEYQQKKQSGNLIRDDIAVLDELFV